MGGSRGHSVMGRGRGYPPIFRAVTARSSVVQSHQQALAGDRPIPGLLPPELTGGVEPDVLVRGQHGGLLRQGKSQFRPQEGVVMTIGAARIGKHVCPVSGEPRPESSAVPLRHVGREGWVKPQCPEADIPVPSGLHRAPIHERASCWVSISCFHLSAPMIRRQKRGEARKPRPPLSFRFYFTRPSLRTSSRSSISSCAVASILPRLNSETSRPCTISYWPPLHRTGKP